METGIEIIAKERQRQKDVEGYVSQHDSIHDNEELARAAMCYVMPSDIRKQAVWGENRLLRFYLADGKNIELYPENWEFKPTPNDRIKELAKAGALIAAEIDRINNK